MDLQKDTLGKNLNIQNNLGNHISKYLLSSART